MLGDRLYRNYNFLFLIWGKNKKIWGKKKKIWGKNKQIWGKNKKIWGKNCQKDKVVLYLHNLLKGPFIEGVYACPLISKFSLSPDIKN